MARKIMSDFYNEKDSRKKIEGELLVLKTLMETNIYSPQKAKVIEDLFLETSALSNKLIKEIGGSARYRNPAMSNYENTSFDMRKRKTKQFVETMFENFNFKNSSGVYDEPEYKRKVVRIIIRNPQLENNDFGLNRRCFGLGETISNSLDSMFLGGKTNLDSLDYFKNQVLSPTYEDIFGSNFKSEEEKYRENIVKLGMLIAPELLKSNLEKNSLEGYSFSPETFSDR
jgi:hypothetical protein